MLMYYLYHAPSNGQGMAAPSGRRHAAASPEAEPIKRTLSKHRATYFRFLLYRIPVYLLEAF
jgi:hypothetical protein